MTPIFKYSLILLLIAILVLLGWNILLFKSRKIRRKNSEEYIEIKYQQQFYIAIFAVLIGLTSFMGYDKYTDLENSISEKIEQKTAIKVEKYNRQMDSLAHILKTGQREIIFENKILKESNQHLNSKTEKANDLLYKMLYDFADVKNELYNSEQNIKNQAERIKRFNNDIEELKKNDFLNQVHLVTGKKFEGSEKMTYLDTVHFNELRTTSGNKLPQFRHNPIVILSKTTGVDLFINEINEKYFVIARGNGYILYEDHQQEKEEVSYDLLIIYRDFTK